MRTRFLVKEIESTFALLNTVYVHIFALLIVVFFREMTKIAKLANVTRAKVFTTITNSNNHAQNKLPLIFWTWMMLINLLKLSNKRTADCVCTLSNLKFLFEVSLYGVIDDSLPL